MKDHQHKPMLGFTLIEVVLVLAIGGLIFLMAFIAFGQVQANRRDMKRREDAQRLLATIEAYYTNSRYYPCGSNGFFSGFTGVPASGRSHKSTYLSACDASRMKDTLATDDAFNVPSTQNANQFGYNDPSGTSEYIVILNYNSALGKGRMWVWAGAKCSGSDLDFVDSVNAYAVRVKLERGNMYCVANT